MVKVNCPNCLKEFKSALAVTRHLSQPLTSCVQWMDTLTSVAQTLESDQRTTSKPPDSSPKAHTRTPSTVHDSDFPMDFHVPVDSEEGLPAPLDFENNLPGHVEELFGSRDSEMPYIERFEGAAKVYGRGQSLQDRFSTDTYAPFRKDNLHYPFASLQDWELASFLLCSTLSMAAIDQFLGLQMVYLQ